VKTELLKHINSPEDLKKLSIDQLYDLAIELRQFIINIVAVKEGHLGASLGVVELTIALHYVFNTPDDLLIWDVGHQAYGHKILTGRRSVFHTNRQFGGVAGFPNRKESEYDAFGTGHSSTSISAALGMAIGSLLKGDLKKQHIAVIGDASIASGMAFEGLNHAGVSDANLLIVLNDNTMGIDPSVGALKNYFTDVKAGKQARKNNIIEALKINYSGPVNGHDLNALIAELRRLSTISGPKFLHIITTKGKGLDVAEKNQVQYHAPGKFDPKTGVVITDESSQQPPKFQEVFGRTLVELAQKNKSIIGITPAMPTGSSLKYMLEEFPDRAFDVGIAEQHAVTLAAGFATQGFKPYVTIYSTFLQRAYDQLIHDVALQELPVVFCVDRAGLVGEDGSTHHGVFDIAYLRTIPNMIICAPIDEIDFRNLLFTAQSIESNPIAIRYPRGSGSLLDWEKPFTSLSIGRGSCITEGSDMAVLTVGTIGTTLISLKAELPDTKVAHYHMRFIKPLDEEMLNKIFTKFPTLITVEEGAVTGGFGSAVLEYAARKGYQNNIQCLGVPDTFIEHGSVSELHAAIGISKSNLKTVILENLNG
jgi:1-deoxy-D-xylulose-5-phosphate synthase